MDAIIIKESIDVVGVVIYALISLALLMLSAMASGSEVAFFSLTRSDLEELEESSDMSSKRVLDLLNNPDRLLATILVTNNMVNICLVITVTQLVGEIFDESDEIEREFVCIDDTHFEADGDMRVYDFFDEFDIDKYCTEVLGR